MIAEAVALYHSFLTDQTATEVHEVMLSQLARRHLYFGTVPVCRVLRPHLYDQESWVFLKQRTEIVLSAFARAHIACMQDATLREQLDLEAYEEALFSLDARTPVPWSSSRLDAFYKPETRYLRFVEYNAETPAGMGYGDQLTEMFLELEPMRRFQQQYHVEAQWGLPELLKVLLRTYHDWGGQGHPQIAIVDWQHVPTRNEHEICKAYFEAHECPTVLTTPQEMEFRNGSLWAGDFRVDLIYKRVLLSELVRQMGHEHAIIQAVRARAVVITNSFSAKLMAKKASLALLSDEQNAHLFTAEQRAAIAEHIPWTRRVADRKTLYNGQPVDLLTFIADHQESLVLKPNDEYGGSGVVIGWKTSPEDWQQTIKHALTTPHVVQERVTIVERDFPMLLEGRLDIGPRFVDANPYIFYGDTVGGCLTRLSSAALLNVTAGAGSVVPMFVIQKR